eukprot:1381835-Amphidinium_carterae.1
MALSLQCAMLHHKVATAYAAEEPPLVPHLYATVRHALAAPGTVASRGLKPKAQLLLLPLPCHFPMDEYLVTVTVIFSFGIL